MQKIVVAYVIPENTRDRERLRAHFVPTPLMGTPPPREEDEKDQSPCHNQSSQPEFTTRAGGVS